MGSEMCIRDSPLVAWQPTSQGRVPTKSFLWVSWLLVIVRGIWVSLSAMGIGSVGAAPSASMGRAMANGNNECIRKAMRYKRDEEEEEEDDDDDPSHAARAGYGARSRPFIPEPLTYSCGYDNSQPITQQW